MFINHFVPIIYFDISYSSSGLKNYVGNEFGKYGSQKHIFVFQVSLKNVFDFFYQSEK